MARRSVAGDMQEASQGGTVGDPERVAFVRFRVGGFPLAAEAGHVTRVAPVPESTRLPGTPAPVSGLGYVAGAPTVLLTLHDRLDVTPEASASRVVVLGTRDRQVGVLADATAGTVAVPVEDVVPTGEVAEPFAADTAADDLFRAVSTVDGERVYVLSPPAVAALAGASAES